MSGSVCLLYVYTPLARPLRSETFTKREFTESENITNSISFDILQHNYDTFQKIKTYATEYYQSCFKKYNFIQELEAHCHISSSVPTKCG